MTNKLDWFAGVLERKPRGEWGESWKLDPAEKITKPCHDCGFCPYGQLVEAFPLHQEAYDYGIKNNILNDDGRPNLNKIIPEHPELDKFSCGVFGHDCPVFYCAEPLVE